jgi:hypothetical protein
MSALVASWEPHVWAPSHITKQRNIRPFPDTPTIFEFQWNFLLVEHSPRKVKSSSIFVRTGVLLDGRTRWRITLLWIAEDLWCCASSISSAMLVRENRRSPGDYPPTSEPLKNQIVLMM